MSSKRPSEATVVSSRDEVAALVGDEAARQYARLLRLLRAARDMFALIPVESNLAPAERDRLITRLGADLDADGMGLTVAELTYDRWDPVEAMVAECPTDNRAQAILLRGLERTPGLRDGEKRPGAVAVLNHSREAIEARFPVPLIVWCDSRSFDALRWHAPDFFDHFTGLVRIVTSEPAVPTTVPAEGKTPLTQPAEATPDLAARANVGFYREQLADGSLSEEERLRALLGLAAALSDLPGTEGLDAAPEADRVLDEARQMVSPTENADAYARLQQITGEVQRLLGNRTKAARALDQAVRCYRHLVSEQAEPHEPALAWALVSFGIASGDLGDREPARDAYREALAIYRCLGEAHPAAFEPYVAMTLNNLGVVLSALGERESARDAYREALEIYRRLAEAHPAAFEQDVAGTLNNLGVVLRDLGEREAARDAYREALAIRRRLAEAHPAAFKQDMAMTLNNLGNVLSDLGERESAREAFREALEIFELLSEKWPAAFGRKLLITLRNYTGITPEDTADPWWQRWKELQEAGQAQAGDQASGADPAEP